MTDEEMAQLKSRIDGLQKLYFALFVGSLVVIGAQWFVLHGRTSVSTLVWIVLLGGAVATRLYRNSLVNKYNGGITGKLQ